MGYHQRYRRVYKALKEFGFSAAKAIEILIEAKRRDAYSMKIIKVVCR